MGTAPTIARNVQRPKPATPDLPGAAPVSWWRSTLALAFFGQALLWAAFPPLGLAPLAWIAGVPWVLLIRAPELSGKRPYLALWFASFCFHLAVLYWVTLPHWATAFGWLALAFYLGLYFPLFIGLSRVAVHRLRISAVIAAPVIWTGLEVARAYILGGFGMTLLAHSQYRWPRVIQAADLFGPYTLSFAMLLVGAAIARMLPLGNERRAWWPALPAVATIVSIVVYGSWRLEQEASTIGPKVALIQGSIDIEMKHDPTQGQRIFDQYFGLSRDAVKQHPDLQLIVWPETMFRYPWFLFDTDFQPPADANWTPAEIEERSRRAIAQTVVPLGVPCLIGIDTVQERREGTERFNSALLVDREGQALDRYDKCYPVPFGEFVPLAEHFPWLYRLTPLAGGLSSGAGPRAMEVAGAHFAPTICYENTLPQIVRGQVNQLRQQESVEADVLVNLTNDGWFWGSSELDMHLACAVLRAVENRKPFLIAANTGFSAWIDAEGRIQAQGRRRDTDVIVAQPTIGRPGSWYSGLGDLPAGLCLLATVLVAGIGLQGRRIATRPESTST